MHNLTQPLFAYLDDFQVHLVQHTPYTLNPSPFIPQKENETHQLFHP